jgi:hypothetical protein
MRFKTLLGLVAIGGAVAYAQKRRGGDLSFDGIKNSLRSTFDNVRSQIDNLTHKSSTATEGSRSRSDVDTDTGYSSRSATSGYGSTDYRSTGTSNVGSSNVSSGGNSSGIGSSRDRNLNGGKL